MHEVLIDTPASYEPVAPNWGAPKRYGFGRKALEEVSPHSPDSLTEIIDLEQAVFGTNIDADDVHFRAKHDGFITSTNKLLREELYPRAKQRVVDGLSAHLAKGNHEREEHFRETFQRRLHGTDKNVKITDPFLNKETGSFGGVFRNIEINGLAFLKLLQHPELDSEELLVNVIIAHEIIHALETSALTVGGIKEEPDKVDLPSRNGLQTIHLPDDQTFTASRGLQKQHTWLNEAFIDDIRQQVLGTQEAGYTVGIATLRTLKDFIPGLEAAMEDAAFGTGAVSKVIGLVEAVLGPLAIERLGLVIETDDSRQVRSQEVERLLDSSFPADKRHDVQERFKTHMAHAQFSEIDTISQTNANLSM